MDSQKAYTKKIEAKLDRWQAEIDKIKARAAELDADARIEANEHIDTLRKKQATARAKLGDLSDATGSAWQELKVGVEEAANDLGDAVQNAASKLG